MLELVVQNSRGAEQRFALQQREYVLGRDPDVHIVLQDRKVSRRHARIFRQGAQYWIEDLGSANGVVLAGDPIRRPVELVSGMELSIGPFQLAIVDDAASAAETFALLGVGEPFEGQRFVLPAGTLQVGRIEGNALVINDGSVSRKQASLVVGPTSVIIEDHGSSNGTWVNDVQVTRRMLNHGDMVRFGNVGFQFVQDGVESAIDFGGMRRSWERIANADRSVQIAAGIAVLSAILLIVTLVVAMHRRSGGSVDVGTMEEAYESGLRVGLSMADHYMKRGEWDQAMRAFRDVLNQDPINPEARSGIAQARRNQRYARALKAAEQDLASHEPQSALYRLSSIPTDSYYADQVKELDRKAREVLGTATLGRAEQACRTSQWQQCHSEAATYLQYQPDSIDGRRLIQQAERAMRSSGMSFAPWVPAAAPNAAELDLKARWRNDRVRTAADKYAAGSLSLANEALESVKGDPEARELAGLLAKFSDAKTRGDGAAVGGDAKNALAAWEQALRLDGEIVPASYASVFRDQLRDKVVQELYDEGKAAFDRAQYGDAYKTWQRALERAPDNAKVLEGLDNLETRAASLLAAIGESTDRSSCRQLEDVMSMTRPASRTHQEAAAKTRRCPR